MQKAIQDGIREVGASLAGDDSMVAKLERLRHFRHAAQTAAAFKELLGTERPWTFEKRGAAPGGLAYRWQLSPASYTAPDGTAYTWSALPVDLLAGSKNGQLSYRGTWPSFTWKDARAQADMRDVSFKGSQRSEDGIWYTNMEGAVGSLRIRGAALPSGLALRHLWGKLRIGDSAGGIEFAQSYGARAIEFSGHRIDDLKFGYRVSNIDKSAMLALARGQRDGQAASATQEQQLAAAEAMMQQMLRAVLNSKTALAIDMSGAYKGHRVQVRGQAALDGDDVVDLKSKDALFQRLNAKLQVRLPVAVVNEVAIAVARMEAERKGTAKSQDPVKQGREVAAKLVRQVLDAGYARLEKGVLVTTVELRHGVLRVNGKEIPLPGPGKTPQPVPTASFLAARRIEDSCVLPPYPAQVVEQDLPLTIELGVLVSPEGAVGEVSLIRASAYPEYDQALLAAFPQCRYIPGMRDGKPVESTQVYSLTRLPGSARP